MDESALKPEFFEREDESADTLFYAAPRLLVHIDDHAIEAARRIYDELLAKRSALLDLMSSYRSHLSDDLHWSRLAGLGLNEIELRENHQLTDYAVHDLNANPRMPDADAEFDGAVITVSIQYMTRPVEIFRDVARVLKPGAPFVVTYSNRMFPTKAVRIWRALDDRERATLIATYFKYAGGFGDVQARDCTTSGDAGHDPLFAVWAHRHP
ncbi:MAG: class I SAM-dependent methyltransferase [Chloroflexi bacterium]|nr:class I SAM-dependent methyltransferase [Chloroflexota bacterium]